MRDNQLKPYLLGLLPETEQTQLEESLLSDDASYEQLLVAEDDLIEAYLQGELTTHEKEKFERVFLAHPRRQQQLQFAQTLHEYANNRSQSDPVTVAAGSAAKWWEPFWQGLQPGWKLAAASVVLVAVVIGAWLWQRQKAAPSLTSPTPLAAVTPPPTTPVGTETAALELSPGQSMAVGEELTEIPLTAKIGAVKLKLWLKKDQYTSYQAALQTYDPPVLKALPGEFKPQLTEKKLKFIEVPVSAADLQGQIFALKLQGITADGTRENADTFRFKVKRE